MAIMSKPKKPSFRRIPTAYLQALMAARLSGAEFRVLFVVVDRTWGWQRPWSERLSLTSFTKDTGLSRRRVVDAIHQLESKCMIEVRRNSSVVSDYRVRECQDWQMASAGKCTRGSEVDCTSGDRNTVHRTSLENAENCTSPSEADFTTTSEVPVSGQRTLLKKERKCIETLKESSEEHAHASSLALRAEEKSEEKTGYDDQETQRIIDEGRLQRAIRQLRPKYTGIDFDHELEKCLEWYRDGRTMKTPMLAIMNWMDRARNGGGHARYNAELTFSEMSDQVGEGIKSGEWIIEPFVKKLPRKREDTVDD